MSDYPAEELLRAIFEADPYQDLLDSLAHALHAAQLDETYDHDRLPDGDDLPYCENIANSGHVKSWLNDAIRAAKAEAWAEGWHAAGDAFIEGLTAANRGLPCPDPGDGPPNPYREADHD